jgi:hypothetical protein
MVTVSLGLSIFAAAALLNLEDDSGNSRWVFRFLRWRRYRILKTTVATVVGSFEFGGGGVVEPR